MATGHVDPESAVTFAGIRIYGLLEGDVASMPRSLDEIRAPCPQQIDGLT